MKLEKLTHAVSQSVGTYVRQSLTCTFFGLSGIQIRELRLNLRESRDHGNLPIFHCFSEMILNDCPKLGWLEVRGSVRPSALAKFLCLSRDRLCTHELDESAGWGPMAKIINHVCSVRWNCCCWYLFSWSMMSPSHSNTNNWAKTNSTTATSSILSSPIIELH